MYGSEVSHIPESSVEGSYWVMIVAFVLEVLIPIIIHFDKSMRFSNRNTYIRTRRGKSRTARSEEKAEPKLFTVEDHAIKPRPVSMRTSVSSLTEAETYKKFASLDGVSGSRGSLYTQSTMFTNVSQADSMESML